MKRIVFPLLLFVLASTSGISQNEVDALRYSRTFIGGTARYLSMGGAFGSLGADFSTASTNPAGLGLYKASEFTVTPAMFVGRTKSNLSGMESLDSRANFNLSNAGIVIASPLQMENGSIVRNYQFGFGVNRINNFNNRMLTNGFNDQNSITDTYVDWSNGVYYGDIEDDRYGYYAYDLNPAWYTYMIDTLPGSDDQYYSVIPPGSEIGQRKEINSWGSMNELVFAFSVNLSDRVYMGASMNFPFIRYFQESYYSEVDAGGRIDGFNKLSIYDELATRGTGFNLKFGTIVRITDYLRMGGAIHSPTWYNNMTDEWFSEFRTNFDGDSYFERTPYGKFDYQLETPWKALGSLSLVLKKFGLLSVDYEYMDYSKARLRSPGYNYYDENQSIQNLYTTSHTLRAGAEYLYGNFAFRLGGGFYSSPFARDINDGKKVFFSGGIGYREKSFFADLAYLQSMSNEDYYLYGSEQVSPDPARNKYSTYNVVLTLGFRL